MTIYLKPSQVKEALRVCLRTGRTPFVEGEPGIGKTGLINELAIEEGFERVIPILGAQCDETDLKGAPAHENGYTVFYPPKNMPREGKVLILLDELPNSSKGVMAAMQQVLNEHRVGDVPLSPDAKIFAAGNSVKHRAGANRLLTTMGSRMSLIHMVADLTDWCKWGAQPLNAKDPNRTRIHPLVLAFNRWRPELFHNFNPEEQVFPCPRTQEAVSNIVWDHDLHNIDPEIRHALYEGCAGEAYGIEFTSFERTWRGITNLDAILLNPLTAPVPTEISALYATVSGLSRRMSPNNAGAVLQYIDRLSEELQTFCIMDASARDKEIMATPQFTTWNCAHPSATL